MSVEFQMINATKDLVAFCDQAKAKSWLAVDTEFVRTRTYYAHLGLVQLATEESCVIVDPLEVEDLAPLWDLISDPNKVTVMHAAGEDIEIIRQKAADAPSHLFDTQIAWSFLSEGDQIGYAGLIEKHFGIALDKSLSRTDWLARPLSSGQLDYAAADTYYLARVYPQLKSKIEESRWFPFFEQECQFQVAKRARVSKPVYAWREVGVYSQMKGVQRSVFSELAKWRMQVAQTENIALPFLLKDAVMAEVSRIMPSHKKALADIEGIHPSLLRKRGQQIIDAVERGTSMPESEWPPEIPRLDDHQGYKAWFKVAKKLVSEIADKEKIAAPMLGSRKQINEVFIWSQYIPNELKGELSPPEMLESWRQALVGDELLKLANDLQ